MTEGTTPATGLSAPRNVIFAGLITGSLLVCWRPLVALFQVALHQEEYTYLLLIIPVGLSLVFLARLEKRPAVVHSVALGTLVLVAAAVVEWSARAYATALSAGEPLTVAIFGLVLFWIGSVVLVYGAALLKSLLFPLLFFFLLVPLPTSTLERFVHVLQVGSCDATMFLFRLFGVPVFRSGFDLALPNINIEVAQECSGIRSATVLIVTSLVLCHLFLRPLWQKLLVVALLIPFAIFKNAVRIFTLSVLGVYVDHSFLEGELHRKGGAVFFGLTLALLVGLIKVLRRIDKTGASKQSIAPTISKLPSHVANT